MNFELSFIQSIFVFIASAIAIWYCCNKLSVLTNFIDDRFKLGNAFGGTIILAIVTNLPEIAITINSSLKGNIDLAVGNILGGIVVQSVLLVLFDAASGKKHQTLSSATNSESSILQGIFLILILALVIMGKQLNPSVFSYRISPIEPAIFIVWLLSLVAMKRFQTQAPKGQKAVANPLGVSKKSSIIWLILLSLLVLFFGLLLETTSDHIAKHWHMNGLVFGATILAFVTSLPEISGGLAFVKNKTLEPIISDIFGGNTFLPVLLLPASIITNKAILPAAQPADIYLTATAIIITSIYIMGMIIADKKKHLGLGYDSWAALLVYLLSVIGLFYL